MIVWLYLAYIPGHFDSTFTALLRESPDIALLGLPTLALAVIWGPIRTILLVRVLLLRQNTGAGRAPAKEEESRGTTDSMGDAALQVK